MIGPFCFWRWIWRSVRSYWYTGYPTDGCTYVVDEVLHNVTVETSRCETCGKWNISWWRYGGPEETE